ncbi:MAG: pilus assembly protein N-terminal domain-containing protein [Proteobacteria bacterium]|nr:pilus assembly protein N-terminal domain-containing protein [Pseudomonadota bacterium]
MRTLLFVVALSGCVRQASPEVPYVELIEPIKRPVQLVEKGSGVVGFTAAPSRISSSHPGVVSVVRFDGERRFHLFAESIGEAWISAEVNGERQSVPVRVVASTEVEADLELSVGAQASFPIEGPVSRVVVGDPGILEFKVVGGLGAEVDSVQLRGNRVGRTHVVVSTGEDAAPIFRWVVVD